MGLIARPGYSHGYDMTLSRQPFLSNLLLAVSLVLLVATAGPLRADQLVGKWVEVRSPHFEVIGNAGTSRMRAIATYFERIDSLFQRIVPRASVPGGQRLQVFVARDERTVELLMPAIVKGRSPGSLGGVFFGRNVISYIAMRSDVDLDTGIQIVNHEFFHYLVQRTGTRLPTWLNEGLADFWSATRLKDKWSEIGRPLGDRLRALTGAQRIPLERLLTVDGASKEYRRPGLVEIFYGESWALVHYLMLGDPSGERTQQLRKYLALVAEGRDSLAAARESFGDLGKLQSELYGYVHRRLFRYARTLAATPPAKGDIAARPISDAEAAAHVAVALLLTQTVDGARPMIALAAEGAPDLAATHTAVGILAVRDDRLDDAIEAFDLASRKPDPGPLPFYGLAVTRLARDGAHADLERVESDLLRAVSAAAGFAPAFSRLAEIYLRHPGDERRALAMIRRAIALAPDTELYELREAQILERAGDHAAARTRINQIVGEAIDSDSPGYQNSLCWNGSLLGFAKDVLPLCDKAVAAQPKVANILDSRALARTLVGDLAGATSDFRVVVADPTSERRLEVLAKRQSWLESLEKNVSPFTPGVLESIYDSPVEHNFWDG